LSAQGRFRRPPWAWRARDVIRFAWEVDEG
jgi:hypothetical protein